MLCNAVMCRPRGAVKTLFPGAAVPLVKEPKVPAITRPPFSSAVNAVSSVVGAGRGLMYVVIVLYCFVYFD